MSDWADYALERLKKQEQDKRVKDEKFVAKQKLLKAHGTPLWHEIRGIVKSSVESLNAKAGNEILTFEVTQNTELRVRNVTNPAHDLLEATFNEERGRLEWRSGGKSSRCDLSVSEDGGVQFYCSMVPSTPASIAKQMLDALLFG